MHDREHARSDVTEPVAIVGTGAVGTALAHAFGVAGVRVAAIASRTPERARSLAHAIGGAAAVAIADVAAHAKVLLLAVSDSAIESACAALRVGAQHLVAHTSGSRDVGALAEARARGSVVGAFHPLAAVVRPPEGELPTPDEWRAVFATAAFAIEGDATAQARLAPLARALGGHPFSIAAGDKARYHLGASMLAAFSAGLAHVAWEGMRRAGVRDDVASAGVGHLLATVARNVASAPSPASALTGPVARGDAGGVRRQADAARALAPEAVALYLAHVRHNIALALAAGRIDEACANDLNRALDERAP